MKRRIGLFLVALCSILTALIPQVSSAASCTNCFGGNETWSDHFSGDRGNYSRLGPGPQSHESWSHGADYGSTERQVNRSRHRT